MTPHHSQGNQTRRAHIQKRIASTLLFVSVPLLLIFLAATLIYDPNPVPVVVAIASLVLTCFVFAYVFVAPDDLTSTATDRTLSIASRTFTYMRQGLTADATAAVCDIILPETLASSIAITDGKTVLAYKGDKNHLYKPGSSVFLQATHDVMETGIARIYSYEAEANDPSYNLLSREERAVRKQFALSLQAGIIAPLKINDRCVGTFELYYRRYGRIDQRQLALATGFAELLSTQLASFELERQKEIATHIELKALQSQVDPHFLFNTISTIVSLVRTQPEKARSLLIDFSGYYRQTLTDSDKLITVEEELRQAIRYTNLMQARFGSDNLLVTSSIDPATRNSLVPPFILQPIIENSIKHARDPKKPLHIHLHIEQNDDVLELQVADDGLGMDEATLKHLRDFDHHENQQIPVRSSDSSEDRVDDPASSKGCGIALWSVNSRIHFFFGNESTLEVCSKENEGTSITIRLVGAPTEIKEI